MHSRGVRFCGEQLVFISKRIFADGIHNLEKGETVSLVYHSNFGEDECFTVSELLNNDTIFSQASSAFSI